MPEKDNALLWYCLSRHFLFGDIQLTLLLGSGSVLRFWRMSNTHYSLYMHIHDKKAVCFLFKTEKNLRIRL